MTNQPKILAIQFQLADQLSVPPTPALPHASAANKGSEMEKSKAPVLSGRTIDYPEFNWGWLKFAAVHWRNRNQVEQIKHRVDQETRKIITRYNTMEEVWEVLDSKFAQEQDVGNVVDVELNNLVLLDCSVA